MFQKTLREVDRIFTNNLHSEFSIEQWREKQEIFIPIFDEDIKPLLGILGDEPFDRIIDFSKEEYIIWPENGVLICEFRLRPPNNYYTALNKPIPQPDNPKGPSATGIELSLNVCRGVNRDNLFYPPFVEVKFQIWGYHERQEFKHFYKNYRRPIEVLLQDYDSDFFTSCYFDALAKYKGNSITKKLDLYYLRKDQESLFSIGKSFNKNASSHMVETFFRNLLILYHSCLGYCFVEKEYDRLLEFSDFFYNVKQKNV